MILRLWTLLPALAALTMSAGLLLAAQEEEKKGKGKGKRGRANPEAMLKQMDTNNDGKISKEEFLKASAERAKRIEEKTGKAPPADFAERRFNQLDTNKDGFLTLEELKAGSEQRKGKGPDSKGKRKAKQPPQT